MSKARIDLSQENYVNLKKEAKRRNISMFSLTNMIFGDFGLDKSGEKVILSVPTILTKKHKEELKEWLNVRMQAICDAYYPEKNA